MVNLLKHGRLVEVLPQVHVIDLKLVTLLILIKTSTRYLRVRLLIDLSLWLTWLIFGQNFVVAIARFEINQITWPK